MRTCFVFICTSLWLPRGERGCCTGQPLISPSRAHRMFLKVQSFQEWSQASKRPLCWPWHPARRVWIHLRAQSCTSAGLALRLCAGPALLLMCCASCASVPASRALAQAATAVHGHHCADHVPAEHWQCSLSAGHCQGSHRGIPGAERGSTVAGDG